MAHTEIGFQVVNRFLTEVGPWGHPDNPPKLTGRTINVMVSPQPKNKRAKNPKGDDKPASAPPAAAETKSSAKSGGPKESARVATDAASSGGAAVNNPFANLSLEGAPPEQGPSPTA
jgi:hypothetical protein